PPDAARVARLASVVDEDVHAAERLHRPRAQLARVVGLREVARLAGRRPLVTLDLRDDLLERLLAAAGDGDPRALGGEHEGGGAADARAGAGDERDLAFECLAHLAAPVVSSPRRPEVNRTTCSANTGLLCI